MKAVTGAPEARPVWASGWFWALVAIAMTAPFWFAPLPPLSDLPGHAGRYHIMLHVARSPVLARYYGFHWALIGNLGADILMIGIGPLLGAERGAWLIAAATPALMTWGVLALSRAIHGRPQPASFLALPFIYAHGFEQGFLNYDLSVAAALLLFALWVAMDRRPRVRIAVFLPAAFAIWICHAVGWGLLCLMAGGFELQAAIVAEGWRPAAALRTAARVWPLAPPILLIARVAARGATPAIIAATAPKTVAAWLISKLMIAIMLLDTHIVLVDAASALAVVAGLYVLVRWGRAWLSPALTAPAALVALATIAMPPVTAGIAQADSRLAPLAVVLFILSFGQAPAHWAGAFVGCALALMGLRLGVTAANWSKASSDDERHLTALGDVPAGARILVLTPITPAGVGWPPMSHLGDLAIIRRDALVNSEWEIAGAQLLTVRANRDIAYHADPSQFVERPDVAQALAAAPLDHFDFAWVLGRYPAGPADPRLKLVFADDATRLFKVDH